MKRPLHFFLVALAIGLALHVTVLGQFVMAAAEGFEENQSSQHALPIPIVLPNHDAVSKSQEVTVSWDGSTQTLTNGARLGPWTLMEVMGEGEERVAVFEDLQREEGRMVFVRASGVVADLPKSLEATFPVEPAKLYRGHTLEEVFDSTTDLLGQEILARPGDPQYEDVAVCFPPLRRGSMTHTFVGVRENSDKVGFDYGGRTSHFDAAVYVPTIRRIRDAGKVWHGLVGGWLPILRFVYPESEGTWSELLAFAPARLENGNRSIQPVWYRVCRIEANQLSWVRCFDSYHPFPPRLESSAQSFYRDLLGMRAHWLHELEPSMRVHIPDRRLADMARHSLVRDMITRDGVRPKYGVFDKDYAGNEHEGFPDTFNADTAAMSEWGLFNLAGKYIDNYFSQYVRDDGSILYRGPETGQYGRMLTVAALQARYADDYSTLVRNQKSLDGVTRLLLGLRAKAKELPANDPAYGIPAGWSEADACLDPEPQRYMQPYFSNAAEMARGFQEIGAAWKIAGSRNHDEKLAAWGDELLGEAAALKKDLSTGMERSLLRDLQQPFLPAIAGVKEPFHVAVARDALDPQFRSYRAFNEMLHSGLLTQEQVKTIVDYRGAHHDIILGVPTAYGYATQELAGFLSYGHAYGLLQHDMIREYLLTLYSLMAHQYTRGSWTAPETRPLKAKMPAAPYCTPAQLVVPMMLGWMLVFEDPASNTLWLAKGTPRAWLAEGQQIAVEDAPTRLGKIGYNIRSHLAQNRIETDLQLPAAGVSVPIKLRLRAPEGYTLTGARVGGKEWRDFDPQAETVTLPAGSGGKVAIETIYRAN
jgi:hypothetical protein